MPKRPNRPRLNGAIAKNDLKSGQQIDKQSRQRGAHTVFALELKQHLAALLGAHHAGEVGDQHCAVRLAVVLSAKVQQLRVRHHQVPRLRLARAAKLADDAREQRDRLAGRAL